MTPLETLNVSRDIGAPPDRVFEAWTSADQIVRWWGGGGVTCPEAHVDLRSGGSYRIANALPDGSITWISGVFETIERPHRLRYTWGVEPTDPDTVPSLVEVEFSPTETGTRVTVNQTRIPGAPAREMFEAGWNGCLDGLRDLLTL
jgi:uncharacterized protein YndB with AHSA1/START domain